AGGTVPEGAAGLGAEEKAWPDSPTRLAPDRPLPLLDGVALCQILRRDHTTTSIPILIVTNETRAEELNRARSAGASVVLVKPKAPDAVVDEVRRLLCRPTAGGDPAQSPAAPAHRLTMSKAHQRTATPTPPAPAPKLTCPVCDRVLAYEQSQIGGVSGRHVEQWDYFRCEACGAFQYRQRTRKLRRV